VVASKFLSIFMVAWKFAIFSSLFALIFGLANSELLAQRVKAPIISEFDYIGPTTSEGPVNERGPIEKANTPIPEEIQASAEQLTGIAGKSNKLTFFYVKYSPDYLSFMCSAHGLARASGEINGVKNHTLRSFYPLLCTSDHYSAYAHGFFVFADFITNQRAIIRVELDMRLAYDDQQFTTRIKGDSVWRQPVGIGWSKVRIGLGELVSDYDLAPLVGPKAIEGRSKTPKTSPGEPPTHGIAAVYETATIRADSGFYLASFPESILKKLEQAFNTSISSPGIVYNAKASLSGEKIRTPFVTDGRGFHLRTDEPNPLESTFRVLMLGADDKEAYAITTFYITRPGSPLAAIVSAELNINLNNMENPGEVHWSGPFIGNWEQIRGFNHQSITDLIRP